MKAGRWSEVTIQLTRLDLCLYSRGTLRAGPRWVMQSIRGCPPPLCSVVHWFALSALAATRASIRQSREGPSPGQIGIYYYSTTTTTTTTLPTYLHTGYQSYAALYAIWAGQVVVARIESPALAAQANQTQQRSVEAVA